MPIKSQCPHCSAVFKVNESYVGQAVVCSKCKNQYQVVASPLASPVPGPPQVTVPPPPAPSASASPAPAVSVAPVEAATAVAATPAVSPRGRRRRGGGKGFFKAPAGGSPFRSKLWLGLLLFIVTFAVKQVVVDYALTRTNSLTEVARVEAARSAAQNAITYKADELQQEIFSGDGSDRGAKQAELRNLQEANRPKLEKVRKEYAKKFTAATRRATASGATSLALLKLTWWLKLLLDFGKIAGCLFVLYAAFQIVCDDNENGHVKTFATVCAGITLAAILTMGAFTILG